MSLDASIPARIVEFIQSEGLEIGRHLPAQMLADRLRVSRSPVNNALALLHRKGLLSREPNRGYFLARAVEGPAHRVVGELRLAKPDAITRTYYRIADDRLRASLPDEFSEALIKKRYRLTQAQLDGVLSRIAAEGWAEKKPGYGWIFSPMLTTPDSLLQSYRTRLALEPAALLEPGYRLEPAVLARCRAAEIHLLEGGIENDTADELHERNEEASRAMREHLLSTLRNFEKIRGILKP